MKYYIYVSPSKVNMLYGQIPQGLKNKIAAKLTINWKLIAAEFSEKESDKDLYFKLKIVADYLEEKDLLGTIDKPKGYFKGKLLMRWGPYGESDYDKTSQIVYFGGKTERTIVGLGGSSHNIIGNIGSSSTHSHSSTPVLLREIAKDLGLQFFANSDFHGDKDSWALSSVEIATTQMKGPKQKIEFIAKKLLFRPDNESKIKYRNHSENQILLGSPIYASLLD